MKTLLLKSAYYTSEEGGSGVPEYPRLGCQIFLAAAYLRKNGLDIDVIDSFDDSIIEYKKYDNVVVWVSILQAFDKGLKYLKKAKNHNCKTIMILNDAFQGLELEAINNNIEIDYIICLHEREIVLLNLLRHFENNEFPEDIRGLIFRKNGKIIDGGVYPPEDTLEHLGSCKEILKTLPLQKYSEFQVQTGRGCPFGCTFCAYNRSKPRHRKPDDVLDEISLLIRYSKNLWFEELDMLTDKKFTKSLCEGIIKNNYNINWGTDCRLDHCKDIDLLKLLKKSGCEVLNFGVECVVEKYRQTKILKNISNIQIKEGINNCLKVGITPSINLMVGFPWDSVETMNETKEFINKYIYVDNIQMFRPQRGTQLYKECKKLGLIKKDFTIADYNCSRDFPMVATENLSAEEVYNYWKKLTFLIVSRHAAIRLKKIGFKGLLKQLKIKKIKLYYFKLFLNILIDKIKYKILR